MRENKEIQNAIQTIKTDVAVIKRLVEGNGDVGLTNRVRTLEMLAAKVKGGAIFMTTAWTAIMGVLMVVLR